MHKYVKKQKYSINILKRYICYDMENPGMRVQDACIIKREKERVQRSFDEKVLFGIFHAVAFMLPRSLGSGAAAINFSGWNLRSLMTTASCSIP